MVEPNDSEWFGFYADGSKTQAIPMHKTQWYLEDSFGLQTLDKAGKIFFETTPGDHLQFSIRDLIRLISKYFE